MEKHKEVLRFACAMSDDVVDFLFRQGDILSACRLSPRFTKACTEILAENPSYEPHLLAGLRFLCEHRKYGAMDIKSFHHTLVSLNLGNGRLTGAMKLLTERSHPGFPSLEVLDLSETHLNREDVESLSEAVRAGKLPQLKELYLSYNDLSHMEREVEALIAAWYAHCEERVNLGLMETGLREEFKQRCRDKYPNVEIDWFISL